MLPRVKTVGRDVLVIRLLRIMSCNRNICVRKEQSIIFYDDSHDGKPVLIKNENEKAVVL